MAKAKDAIKRPPSGWDVQYVTTHPGQMIREEFLKPMGMSANQLALRTRVPATRITEILHERRGITPDTALRLARFFGTSAEFWMNMQVAHDLSKARLERGKAVEREVEPFPLEAIVVAS